MADKDILDKISKLRAHAESAAKIGSDEEAQAFATMMQRLLAKHKLSMTDVEFADFQRTNPVSHFSIDFRQYPDIELKKSRQAWSEQLAAIVGVAHNCRHVVYSGSNKISLVGRKHEVQQCEFVLIVLWRYVEHASDRARHDYYHSHITGWRRRKENVTQQMKGYRDNWIAAFVRRLSERYEEERKRMAYEVGKNSTAMVRVSDLRVVDDWITGAKREGTLGNAHTLGPVARTGHADGYRHGREAAEKVNLRSNAVEKGESAKQLGGNVEGTLELVVTSDSISVYIDDAFAKTMSSWTKALRYCGTMGMPHVFVTAKHQNRRRT